MAQLAYNIRGAATTAAVTEHAIQVAVREGALLTRTINGVRVITHHDLTAWVRANPSDEPTLA